MRPGAIVVASPLSGSGNGDRSFHVTVQLPQRHAALHPACLVAGRAYPGGRREDLSVRLACAIRTIDLAPLTSRKTSRADHA